MQCGALASGQCTVVRRAHRSGRRAGRASSVVTAAQAVPVKTQVRKEGPILIDGQLAHNNTKESVEVLLSMTDYVEKNVSGG